MANADFANSARSTGQCMPCQLDMLTSCCLSSVGPAKSVLNLQKHGVLQQQLIGFRSSVGLRFKPWREHCLPMPISCSFWEIFADSFWSCDFCSGGGCHIHVPQ
ncbi:hypothetical protein HZ326_9703 [Fusarium oxysporum f. sp. albedinis]|nr:hypothetical protein HZ326_9703 [Fusarium oxysporum f. sp. albedinis]